MAPAVYAQEISSYETDSTAIYNALYNPNDYAQSPVKLPQRKVLDRSRISTQVNMGTSFGKYGSSQFVAPEISYEASDRLHLHFGMGMIHSSLRLMNFASETSAENNLRAIQNYYSVGARYSVSPRCDIYGSLIYMHDNYQQGNKFSQGKDRYMATFGATFNITESLQIGIQIRQSENMSPFYTHGYAPYGWGM